MWIIGSFYRVIEMRKNPHLGEDFKVYLKRKLKDPKHRKGYELVLAKLKLKLNIQVLGKELAIDFR